jgi:hypothetical protein
MLADGTSGLSSAYQITSHTAITELGQNLLDTSGFLGIPVLEVVGELELAKLFEGEVISIKISPQHEEMAFYLLSKVCQFQSLPDNILVLRRSDLRFLEEAGIPYEQVRRG